ncbi:hypothetical protein ACF0H5_012355 [Mactra antiquata]
MFSRLAGIYNDTCWCADYLHESHAKVSNSYCDQTCPGYNISDPGQQVFCGGTQGEMAVFTTMDDTVCDPGWIGFNGHCYYFNTYSTMNFNDGRDFCTSVDANLVSITSQAEFDFLKITRDAHDDLRIDEDYNTWWLGMVDSGQNLLYSWVDGSIMTLLQFLHSPETEHVQCAIDDALTDFKWAEHGCNGQHQVMCKKPAVGPRCISTENLMPNISIPNDMVFGTYCIEFCKGQQLKYAVYENTTCHCMDTLPSNSSVSYASCNFTCPGHQFQFCGGENGTYSVVEVSNMISAVSCEELNLYGLDNNTFAVQNVSGGIAYTQCGVSACPPSWILLDDVCYKYQLVKRNIYDAIGVCAKEDSYMASIETTEEIDTLISAAQNISLYKPIGHWRIGLLALSKNGGYYRWSNGRMTELPGYWSNDVTGQQSIVVVRSYDATNWVGTDTVSDQSKFICEKGLGVNNDGGRFRIFTGISHGGYNMDVFVSQEGFLTDNDVADSWLYTEDLYDNFGYVSFYTHYHSDLIDDGGVICKKDIYRIGCYEKPTTLLTIMEEYGSMEIDYLGCNYLVNVTSEASYTNCPSNSLTQCMYWCKGSNYQYAAIHQRECHCYHSNPILTSAKGDCDIVCDAVESQMCGGIDIYMDKVFNVINISLHKQEEQSYVTSFSMKYRDVLTGTLDQYTEDTVSESMKAD